MEISPLAAHSPSSLVDPVCTRELLFFRLRPRDRGRKCGQKAFLWPLGPDFAVLERIDNSWWRPLG